MHVCLQRRVRSAVRCELIAGRRSSPPGPEEPMQERMNEHFGVTMRSRPMGITVLAVLAVVTGILSLVSGLALLGVGGLSIFGAGSNGGNVLALGAVTFAIA